MKKLQRNSLRHAGLLPLLAALLTACSLVGAARPAVAAGIYTVTSTLDDGSSGTLRSAISFANSDPGATVVFAPGLSGVFALQGAELDITTSMTIIGPGAGVIQVDGGGAVRLFNITSSTAQVTLSGLFLRNGSALQDPNGLTAGAGGAIYNLGALTLTDCAFTGNTAFYGGAIYNSAGTLALTGCTFTGNSVGDGGGGGAVYNDTGALALTVCTFTSNSASYAGGLYNGGTAALTACTVSTNSAKGAADGSNGMGGGLYNDGMMTLAACVIKDNVAYSGSGGANGAGGGLYSDATLTLMGCTLNYNAVGGGADGSFGTGNGLDNLGTATLTDDIFYADGGVPDIANDTSLISTASITASYCDIQGSSAGTSGIGPNVSFGARVLDADPLFVRPQFTQGQADPGDLHLQAGSPCVGAGVADPANASDRDGNTRPAPPSIGAYEYPLGPPIPNPQSINVPQDTPVTITLTGSDPAGLPLAYRVASGPANGTLTGTAPNLLYTPNAGYTGADGFTFAVSNGFLERSATINLAVIPIHAVDVSGQVSVGYGGFVYRRGTQTFAQQLTLTNSSGGVIRGPVTLALDQLSRNARLVNATGVTAAAPPAGSPTVTVQPGDFAPGVSVLVNLSFSDPNFRRITYAVRILSGSGD